MKRSVIVAWCLYDFANSGFIAIFVSLFAPFYVQHIVGPEGGGDAWWGRSISVSMLLVALSAPFLGAVADRAGGRKQLLAFFTGLSIVATLGFTTLEPGMVVRGFILAAVANFGYEAAIVFYNAYLPEIAPANQQGRVSGWGYALGYVGSILALGLGLVFYRTEGLGLNWAWIEVAGQFALFSLPALLILPAPRRSGMRVMSAGFDGVRDMRRILKEALAIVPLRRFLGAYFLFIDGVNTVIVFAGLYAAKTLHFDNGELLFLFLVVQASACFGALLMAKPTDTWGPKAVVMGSLVLWVAVVTVAAIVQTKGQFFVVAGMAGLGLGSVQAASRSLMASLIPTGKEAEFFGFYALCGKTSSIIGPILVGELSVATGSQRIGIVSVAAFFIIGLLLLRRVHPNKPPAT